MDRTEHRGQKQLKSMTLIGIYGEEGRGAGEHVFTVMEA
jgi:hypothetical protein